MMGAAPGPRVSRGRAHSVSWEQALPSPADTDRYRRILEPFKKDNGDLLAALHAVQDEFGWVSRDGVAAVAKQIALPEAFVFGAVSFYAEFRTSPPPRVTVHWCSGPACRLKGGDNIRRVLESVFGFGMESQSADGRTGLHVQQCDGSCQRAPLVWVQHHDPAEAGPFATLEHHRGAVVGPLGMAEAVTLARRLAGEGSESQ
jgi:NADH-quinone oxidoreductase subunit E